MASLTLSSCVIYHTHVMCHQIWAYMLMASVQRYFNVDESFVVNDHETVRHVWPRCMAAAVVEVESERTC